MMTWEHDIRVATRPWFVLVALVVASLSAAGCSDRSEAAHPSASAQALHGKLLLTGSSTVAPLASEIGKRFEAMHPDVRIDVQTGGSSKGIADASTRRADVGMASRTLKPQDPAGIVAHTIARDGVCILLHVSNPITDLTREQIESIYTGRVTNWKQLGGEDRNIVVVNKAEGRATLEVFLGYLDLKPEQVKASVVIGDNEQAIAMIAQTPEAIGYVSIGSAEYAAEHGQSVKLPTMGGVTPSTATVGNGMFPIVRPLNMVTVGEPEGLAAAFIAYAVSPTVDDLVLKLNYVPSHD